MALSSREFIRKKIIPFILGYTIKSVITAIGWTCKFRIEGKNNLIDTAAKSKCIIIAWHNRVGLISEIIQRIAPKNFYAAMISNSRDGEIISVIANSFKHGRSIRVPHDARSAALHSMITQLKYGKEIMIVTPDGPRGPRYKIKPGVVIAAKETQANVIPLTWNASNVWRFRTWDQLMLPKPFSTITVKIGNPLTVTDTVEEDTEKLQNALLVIQDPEPCT